MSGAVDDTTKAAATAAAASTNSGNTAINNASPNAINSGVMGQVIHPTFTGLQNPATAVASPAIGSPAQGVAKHPELRTESKDDDESSTH